ncbi:hypothetical protein ABIC63_002829 [Pseudacidovorax sp. 1753]|uniref:hypothetical protein n=1 Tax=Pseudacidovorax sp. 1753 TaxID=3156419 RepID=UPI003394ED52
MSVNEPITTYQHRLAFSVEGSEYGATGRMQIEDEMKNPFGTVHVGAFIWFADVVATHAALGGGHWRAGTGAPLAVTLDANLLSNRGGGVLHASDQARSARRALDRDADGGARRIGCTASRSHVVPHVRAIGLTKTGQGRGIAGFSRR